MTLKVSGKPLTLADVRTLHSQTIGWPADCEVTTWSNSVRHDIIVTGKDAPRS